MVGVVLRSVHQNRKEKTMFLRILLTNVIGVVLTLVFAGLGYTVSKDGASAGAGLAAVVYASFGYFAFTHVNAGGLVYAHAARSVGLMVLAFCAWQLAHHTDATSLLRLTSGALAIWSFQQAFQAGVVAEKVVKHNKLSISYGFAAWGVVGLLLGPLALIIAGLVHGQKKIKADIALRTSAT